jgi:hypothetical protein
MNDGHNSRARARKTHLAGQGHEQARVEGADEELHGDGLGQLEEVERLEDRVDLVLLGGRAWADGLEG